MALSQSLPTPTTRELFLVVVREAVGAPLLEFPVPVAPIAPEPFVPLRIDSVKVITVIEETVLRDRVAVTIALIKGAGAKASARFRPSRVVYWFFAPRTPGQSGSSDAGYRRISARGWRIRCTQKASKSSLLEVVEKGAVATVVLLVP